MVHTGTANQGHYFSYIRDPKLDARNSPPDAGENPCETNDSCKADQPVPPPLIRKSSPSPDAESATTSPRTTSLSTDNSGHSTSVGGDDVSQPATTTTGTAAAISAALAPESDMAVSPLPVYPVGDDGNLVSGGTSGVRGAADDQREGGHHWCEFNDTVVKEWAVEGRRGGNEVTQADADGGGRVGGLSTDCFGGQQTMQVRVRRVGRKRDTLYKAPLAYFFFTVFVLVLIFVSVLADVLVAVEVALVSGLPDLPLSESMMWFKPCRRFWRVWLRLPVNAIQRDSIIGFVQR